MPLKVILADDHAMLCEGIKSLLEKHEDITVVACAHNGNDCVELTRQLKPDIVLMDISMSGAINGIEATRIITTQKLPTKIIILSLHCSIQHVYMALSVGALGYVSKQNVYRELAEAIFNVARGKEYWSPDIRPKVEELRLNKTPFRGPLESLSTRELQVLKLVADGSTSANMAEIFGISSKSVETYRSRLMTKLGIATISGLVKFSIENGLTNTEYIR